MTKDEALALDMALEALEGLNHENSIFLGGYEKEITAIKKVRALDKKAENARELGLDYEPVQEPVEIDADMSNVLHGALMRSGKVISPPAAQPAPVQKPLHPEIKKVFEDYFDKCFRALAAAQPAPVQDGWILVPVTLTNDMTSAMADALEDPENERSSWDLAENMWRAMLPKVPTPPAAQRTWVGLTDEDCKGLSAGDRVLAIWADKTLKEKNTTPPTAQRQWVGLSKEDREQHRNDWHSNIHDKEFQAIEARLKELNT
jgi:hypothetical protein